jgi:hypothetical protein
MIIINGRQPHYGLYRSDAPRVVVPLALLYHYDLMNDVPSIHLIALLFTATPLYQTRFAIGFDSIRSLYYRSAGWAYYRSSAK